MANFVVLNDNTLRQRLRQFGFKPDGPITETTRDVYVRKLQRLESTRGAQSNTLANVTPASTPAQRGAIGTGLFARGSIATPPSSSDTFLTSLFGQARLPVFQNNQSELIARSSPSRDTSRSGNIVHGKCI